MLDEELVIRRNPIISIWFIVLLAYLWFKIFGRINLLENIPAALVSVGVAFMFLIVPVLYLKQKICIKAGTIYYYTMFSKTKIKIDSIQSIYKKVSVQTTSEGTDRYHSCVIEEENGKQHKIPYHFFVGKKRGTIFVRKVLNRNPSVNLDSELEKIRDGVFNKGIFLSRIMLFIFTNVIILFVLNLVSNN